MKVHPPFLGVGYYALQWGWVGVRRVPRPRRKASRQGPNPYGHRHQQIAKRLKVGGVCAMAYRGGCHGPLHADHIVPLSMGGQVIESNYQLLCEFHNISKGGRNRKR